MAKYLNLKLILSVLISALIVIALYFLVATIVKTERKVEVIIKQTDTNTKNIETIVQFLNQATQPK